MGAELPRDVGGRLIDNALAAALARVTRLGSILVASDYDGTLAPIVGDPGEAVPHGDALDAFLRIAGHPRIHAAIVSGRSADVLERLVGVHDEVTLIGNHGAVVSTTDESARVDALTTDLRSVAARFSGAHVESKPTGAAFHYRHVTDKQSAAADARQVLADHGVAAIDGKMVIEAVIGVGDKGTAVTALAQRFSAEAVVFVGDDTTDEAAFAILGPSDVSIKVGQGPTAATHRVSDTDEVALVFTTLSRHLAGDGL